MVFNKLLTAVWQYLVYLKSEITEKRIVQEKPKKLRKYHKNTYILIFHMFNVHKHKSGSLQFASCICCYLAVQFPIVDCYRIKNHFKITNISKDTIVIVNMRTKC